MNSQQPQEDDSALLSSFDDTMRRLRDGDPEASRQVFNRYVGRLLALARTRMDPRFQSKEDPEDVVQSVFRSFFQRYGAGTLELRDWENLWSMLALITGRKCRSRRRHYSTESRDVTREAAATDRQGESAWELPGAGGPGSALRNPGGNRGATTGPRRLGPRTARGVRGGVPGPAGRPLARGARTRGARPR